MRALAVQALALAIALTLATAAVATATTRRSVERLRADYVRLFANLVGPDGDAAGIARAEAAIRGAPALSGVGLWVVDRAGHVVAARDGSPPPTDAPPPAGDDGIALRGAWWSGPTTAVARLGPDRSLVVRTAANGPLERLTAVRFALLAAVLALAAVGAVGLSWLYARAKAREARAVLAAMRGGDLRARFRIGPIDEAAALMRDFNAMADEIERLVGHLRLSERARRDLLRALGHDLRTPLTALRAAAETLAAHHDRLAAAERAQLAAVVNGEIAYFTRLVDHLFAIGDLCDPLHGQRPATVDLAPLLRHEVEAAAVQRPGLRIALAAPATLPALGDELLLTRLLRNALDNALKNAATAVTIAADVEGGRAVVRVRDDGAGAGAEALRSFGERRDRRVAAGDGPRASLGLGSEIMRRIAEAFGGEVALANHPDGGAELRIALRRPDDAPIP